MGEFMTVSFAVTKDQHVFFVLSLSIYKHQSFQTWEKRKMTLSTFIHIFSLKLVAFVPYNKGIPITIFLNMLIFLDNTLLQYLINGCLS